MWDAVNELAQKIPEESFIYECLCFLRIFLAEGYQIEKTGQTLQIIKSSLRGGRGDS